MSFSRRLSFRNAFSVGFAQFSIWAAIVLILGAAPLCAQNAATGVVSGQVTDQQGAATPGATVKLL